MLSSTWPDKTFVQMAATRVIISAATRIAWAGRTNLSWLLRSLPIRRHTAAESAIRQQTYTLRALLVCYHSLFLYRTWLLWPFAFSQHDYMLVSFDSHVKIPFKRICSLYDLFFSRRFLPVSVLCLRHVSAHTVNASLRPTHVNNYEPRINLRHFKA